MTVDGHGEALVVLGRWYYTGLVSWFLAEGMDVYLVMEDGDEPGAPGEGDRKAFLRSVTRAYTVSSFNSLEELAEIASDLIVRQADVRRVVSLTEYGKLAEGYLESLLLPGSSDVRASLGVRDKRFMKRRAAQAGVPVTSWFSLPDRDDAAELEKTASNVSYPAVIKPASGTGTMNTVRVERAEDLSGVVRGLQSQPGVVSRHLMVEEFVSGTEYFVDALWVDGAPIYLLIFAYRIPRLGWIPAAKAYDGEEHTEFPGSYLVQPDERPELYERVLHMSRRLNRALGIRRGPTHMEFFERGDGEIRFSEVATRVGGGAIYWMLSQYLGMEPWHAIARSYVTDDVKPLPLATGYIGAVQILPSRPGRISRLPSDDRLDSLPGVTWWRKFRKEGDTVTLSHPSEFCVSIILRAADRSAGEELAARIAREIRIEVDDPPQS